MADIFDEVEKEDIFDQVIKETKKPETKKPLMPKLAKMVVDIVTPRPQATNKQNVLEQFTGPLSLESAKRLLSPQVGQFGLSAVAQKIGEKGQQDFSKMVDEFVQKPGINQYPRAAAAAGTLASVTAPLIMQTPRDVAAGVGLSGAGSAVKTLVTDPIRRSFAGAAEKVSIPLARRHLGYQKSDLMSSKSYTDSLRKQINANKAAKLALDSESIGLTGNVADTAKNILKIKSGAENQLNGILKGADSLGAGIDTAELAVKMESALKPTQPGEKAAFAKVLNELGAGGNFVPLSYVKMKIKPNLGKAYDLPPSGDTIAFLRKASDFLEKEIGSQVEKHGGSKALSLYKSANALYGTTKDAATKAYKAVAGEMGNNVIGLPSYMAGAGQLLSGNPAGAAAKVGAYEAARQRSSGAIASALSRFVKPKGSAVRQNPALAMTLLKAIKERKNAKK